MRISLFWPQNRLIKYKMNILVHGLLILSQEQNKNMTTHQIYHLTHLHTEVMVNIKSST